MYELNFEKGATIGFDDNMEIVSYSNFDKNFISNQSNVSKQSLSNENETIIETLKKEYNIDDSYKLEILEDNGDIRYSWGKIGYNNIINQYDSLRVRIDGITGQIVTYNRFKDEFDETEIKISEDTAKEIALNTKVGFSEVTSCDMRYIEPNFFWNDTNKIYDKVNIVRLAYAITIDDIYKVYIDAETGENIGGDIIKAANNARAYAFNGFAHVAASRKLANTYLAKLGYTSSSVGIANTFTTNPVISFVQDDLKAYGLYIDCHGSTTKLSTNSQTILTTSQVKGNWHFVFLDACSTAANANWPNAFRINSSYSKRAFLGWGTSVDETKAYEFCREFWPEIYNGEKSYSVRYSAIAAAERVKNYDDGTPSTPIRFYGDSSYNGRAY